MAVKMDRPSPAQSSTKSPEKCWMPICKVWGRTERRGHGCDAPFAPTLVHSWMLILFLLDPEDAESVLPVCPVDPTSAAL